MNDFWDRLLTEIEREKRLIEKNSAYLARSPKGFLTVKQRAKFSSHYWAFYEGRYPDQIQRQVNINNNPGMIAQLTNKLIASDIVRYGKNNLPYLEKLAAHFKDLSPESILAQRPEKYQEAFSLLNKAQIETRMAAPYSKSIFNPEYHTHITDYGERVRSKSEQILANTFYAFGIPFHYEEEFVHEVKGFRRTFPDFTILLPKKEFIIWEHLGLLSSRDYCNANAEKLHIYQQSGLTLGENLILTMDDSNGNLSSTIINKIIHNEILPRLQGIEIDKFFIAQGVQQSYMGNQWK